MADGPAPYACGHPRWTSPACTWASGGTTRRAHAGRGLALHAHGGPRAAPACTSRRTRRTPARRAAAAVADHRERHAAVTTHLSQPYGEPARAGARWLHAPRAVERTGQPASLIAARHVHERVGHAAPARPTRARARGHATGGRIAPTRAMQDAGIRLALATDNMRRHDRGHALGANLGRILIGGIDDGWHRRTCCAWPPGGAHARAWASTWVAWRSASWPTWSARTCAASGAQHQPAALVHRPGPRRGHGAGARRTWWKAVALRVDQDSILADALPAAPPWERARAMSSPEKRLNISSSTPTFPSASPS